MSSKKILERQDQKKGTIKHVCPICVKGFTLKCTLNRHALIHSGLKPYKCETCSKEYNQRASLNRHLLTHSDKKPCKCQTCSKKFRTKDELKHHMQTHSEEKAYECPKCLKQFRRRETFKDHMNTQCGEENLKCPICEKRFSRQGNLNKHVRGFHQNKRPFSCDICQKGFFLNSTLKIHTRIHSNDKPYICDTCRKSFAQRGDIIKHFRVHSGEKAFICSTCRKPFAYKSYLKEHHKRLHAKDEHKASSSAKSEEYSQQNDLLSNKSSLINLDAKIFCQKLTEHEIKEHTSRGYFENKNKGTEYGLELNRSELPSIKEESNIDDELADDEPTLSTSYPRARVKQEADDVAPSSINLLDHLFIKQEEEIS